MCGSDGGYGDVQATTFLNCPCARALCFVDILHDLVFDFLKDVGVVFRIFCSANVGPDGDKKVFDLEIHVSKENPLWGHKGAKVVLYLQAHP